MRVLYRIFFCEGILNGKIVTPPLFLSKLFPYISSVNVSNRNFFFFF